MAVFDTAELTPAIPHEVARYLKLHDANAESDTAHGVRGVGQPGKVGVLEANLAKAASGRTTLRRGMVKAPMQLTRPLYVDPEDERVACVYLRQTGGGIAQNDRIRQRFTFEDNAEAVITTQAATNVHRMNSGFGSLWCTITVAPGAVAEYLPGHTTLYGGTRLVQYTEFSVAPGGALLASEMTMTGRLARGERDAFDVLALCTRVNRDGRVIMSDNLTICGPGTGRSEMLYSRWPVWGTVLVVPPQPDAVPGLVRTLQEGLRDHPVELGVTTMAREAGIVVRLAADNSIAVKRAIATSHDVARRALVGKGHFDLRTM